MMETLGNIFAFISTIICLSTALSLPIIEFKQVTPAKYIYQSQQEKTNADILEHAFCKFNTFKDPASSTTPSYYHRYTQTIANYTTVTILDDTLKQYSTPNTALASQLPYQLYYVYTAFDSCVSPKQQMMYSHVMYYHHAASNRKTLNN